MQKIILNFILIILNKTIKNLFCDKEMPKIYYYICFAYALYIYI